MTPTSLSTMIVIVAEIALALHPILIKQISVNLPTQLLARLGTYSVLASTFADKQDIALSWGSFPTAVKSVLFGFMNLVHIGSSYLSYQHLPAGSALALFYTYPFFNILAGVLFLGLSLSYRILPLMVMAFVGVLLISRSTKEEETNTTHTTQSTTKRNIPLGIAASLVSALTETAIFLIAKTGEEPSALLPMLKLYPGALLGLLVYLGVTGSGTTLNTSLQNWIPLILFNVFVGFLGYSLRFYSIPRLSTAVFSLLTFIGVAAGYGWGLTYANEVPSVGALVGAGFITGALSLLKLSS